MYVPFLGSELRMLLSHSEPVEQRWRIFFSARNHLDIYSIICKPYRIVSLQDSLL